MGKISDLINKNKQNSGFLQDLILHFKLILCLIGDRRVNFLLKLLPIAAAIYVISPVDLIPNMALPIIGALDDAAAIWLGTTLFIALCPQDIVKEHTLALGKSNNGIWKEAVEQGRVDEVVDAEASDVIEE
jgi:uncharacterized membrane protein YkvA (DUF1232 family)